MTTILNILSGIITFYSLLITAHIILSWLPGMGGEKLSRWLHEITEPYLRLFRKISFLQIGPIDFSPIVALILLNLLNIILVQWGRSGRIDLLQIIILIASVILNTVAFLGIIFCILIAVRLILIWRGQVSHIGSLLDQLLQPLSYRIISRITPRALSYRAQLALFAFIVLSFSIMLRLLSAWFLLR